MCFWSLFNNKRVELYENRGKEVFQSTIIGRHHVIQYYTSIHSWKQLQSQVVNPYFGVCRCKRFTLAGESVYVILAKRYRVIHELVPTVDWRVNEIFYELLDLKKTTSRPLVNTLLEIVAKAQDVDSELDKALHLMVQQYQCCWWYDFRIDNVLFDDKTNHYILWDVLLS